jgi:hypothetical protein
MAMAISLVPKRIYSSIYDLRPETLTEEGVKVVFADLDNTLVRYRQKTATPEVLAWKGDLDGAGITLFIVSNSRKPTRAKTFAESLGVGFIGHAGKPKRGGFQRAMELTGAKPEEAVMIGDQIFTDILGANNAGIRSWLIQPVDLDNPFRVIRYGFEGLFRAFCKDDRRGEAHR